MNLPTILDVIEGLLVASEHPDVVGVERYGTGTQPCGPSEAQSKGQSISGVLVRYRSTATASLWGAIWPGATEIPMPDDMPAPYRRASRLPIFVVQLLDAAHPQQFRSWHLVSLPGIGLENERGPGGLTVVCADGTTMLLRSTATGVTVGEEPEKEPFPDYVIPEGVTQWQNRTTASAPSAERR